MPLSNNAPTNSDSINSQFQFNTKEKLYGSRGYVPKGLRVSAVANSHPCKLCICSLTYLNVQ